MNINSNSDKSPSMGVNGKCKFNRSIVFPWSVAIISTVFAINYGSTSYNQTVIGSHDFTITAVHQNFPSDVTRTPHHASDYSIELRDKNGAVNLISIGAAQDCSVDLRDTRGKTIRITEKKVDLDRFLSHKTIILRAEGDTLAELTCNSAQILSD